MEEWGLTMTMLLNVMTRCSLVTVLHCVCGVLGCGHWLALARHKLLPSSATLLAAADNPHHVISVLQTLNNYLPSRLSSPGTTLAGGASARYSGQLMLSFYYLTFRQK